MDSTCGDMACDREEDSGIESTAPSTAPDPADSTEDTKYIRIAVPDLKAQKCLKFHLDDSVWLAKQRVLTTIARELRDGINYGLYCPPMNGKAGKFLDEERPLRDYPLQGPIGFLEFKYKRRVYKLMLLNERKLRQLHTKANLKQFFEAVKQVNHEKISKFLTKGLDPNFHDHETGETPLTQSTSLEKCRHMVISLVSGGAHLDFRSREGLTPMHKAGINGSKEAIKTLLDLGSSPNYKDARGLTPLYHAVMHHTNAHCVEMLLHDHSVIGISDERGWCEVHQACKYGHVQHLEHLLFYGADMNIQNSSGNTALHVAAVNNQESCARVLLFRGAEKSVLNYANQDAFQVAVIAGNNDLAEIIKSFKPEDVVPFQEVPKYNDKRRATIPGIFTLQRCRSDPRLNLSFADSKPSSPCLSNNSFPHYISNGSLCDSPSSSGHGGGSGGGAIYRKGSYQSDSPRSMSISSAGSVSGLSGRNSVTSDSVIYSYPRQRLYAATPGRKFVCVKSHKPLNESELPLKKGQFVEVVSVGEGGYWEGRSGIQEGWFPSTCVEEVRIRRRASAGARSHCPSEDTVLVNRATLAALVSHEGENAPRTVVLQRGKSGFGFVLRGAKAQAQTSPTTLEFTPTSEFPALQYLDRVDKGSAADRAGLKPRDFVLEINNEIVVNATHEHTVRLIKNSGDTLAMKVITVSPLSADGMEHEIHMDGTRTLPAKKRAGPAPPRRNPLTSLTASKANAQSIRDSLAELEKLDDALAQYEENSESDHHLNMMAQRKGVDPNNKTASIRSRHSSSRLTAYELEDIMSRQDSIESDSGIRGGTLTRPARVAAPVAPKIYNSVSQMKNKGHSGSLNRASSTPNLAPNGLTPYGMAATVDNESYSRHITRVELGDADTLTRSKDPSEHTYAVPVAGLAMSRKYGSQDHIIDSHRQEIPPPPKERAPQPPHSGSRIPPPPNHPPPLPPYDKTNGEVVKISTHAPTYANISQEIAAQKKGSESPFESSFRPGINARLVREPRELPPAVGPPRMSHSRTNSSISSNSSNQSEQITVQGAREKFEGGTKHSGTSPAAASSKYYEPEPDYDTPAAPEVQSPSVRNMREQYAARDSQKPPSQPPPPPPVEYSSQNDSRESSPFSNAIKEAAVKREQRRKSEESIKYKPQASPPPSHVKRQISTPSAPPPPPPPPPAVTPPKQGDSIGRKVPPQVQQQLDANKKLEDSHAALMQAIAKRRNIVDNKEHSPKEHSEVRSSPTSQSQAHVTASISATTTTSSKTEESQEETNFRAMAERARQEWLQKKAESTLDRRKRNPSPVRAATPERPPQNFQPEENKENAPKNPPPPPPIKHSPTPPRARECSPKVATQRQNGNNNNGSVGGSGLGDLASVIAQRAMERQRSVGDIVDGNGNQKDKQISHSKVYKSGGGGVSSGPDTTRLNHSGPGVSGSGAREQLSQESRVQIHGATVDSSNTEKDTVQKEADSEVTMSVAARTKMFEASKLLKKPNTGPPTPPKSGEKTVYKAGSPSKLPFHLPAPYTDGNDRPPPMVPPPPAEFGNGPSGLDIISNGSHSNGHETVGWVINSTPNKMGYHNGTRPTELHLNGSSNGGGVTIVSHTIPEPDIDIPFIPPPPLFDTEMEHASDFPLTSVGRVIQDDAASMVSSLSTLSTLSSNEQDSYPGADSSGGFSASRNQRYVSSSKSQEVLDIAPPPGFDDYGEISTEHHYEELPVVNDFIPPPMGFDIEASNNKTSPSAYAVSNISNFSQQGFESKSIETWTVNDVSDWLMSLQLGEHRHRFLSHRVDGRRLSLMGRNDLIALGVTQVGHRMTLERAIKKAQLNR